MQGAVGSAMMVPGFAVCRMCARASRRAHGAPPWPRSVVTLAEYSMRSRTPGPIAGRWRVTNSPKVCHTS